MTSKEKDKKIFEEISSSTKDLNSFLDEHTIEEIKKNTLLQKAICFRLLHLARAYKKLGGRYAERFGEFNETLKGYMKEIESKASSFDPLSLIEDAKKELPAILSRVEKIKESL